MVEGKMISEKDAMSMLCSPRLAKWSVGMAFEAGHLKTEKPCHLLPERTIRARA
jgi:hypothetical protein